MDNNEKLIKLLSENVTPVIPQGSLIIRLTKWIIPSILCGLLGFFTLGFREEIFMNMSSAIFIIENIFIVIAGICLASAAFISATPGYKIGPVIILSTISFIIWSSIFIFSGTNTQGTDISSEMHNARGMLCTMDVILLAVIPGIITFIMLKRLATTNLGYTGAFAVLAITSIAVVSSRFMCHNMDPAHLIIWHFLPVLIMGFIGILLGKKLLKW
jgi:hypothetical protein